MNEAEAKKLLAAALAELGIDQDSIHAVWLTEGGYIVGRRFECGPIHAVWFFDETELKIVDQAGTLLKVSALPTTTGKAA